MRFSTSLAAVALLTFGNLFPSTVGVPIGLSGRTFSSAVPIALDRTGFPVIPKPPPAPKPPQPPRPPPPEGGPKPPGAGAGPKEVLTSVLKTYFSKDVPNAFKGGNYIYKKQKLDRHYGSLEQKRHTPPDASKKLSLADIEMNLFTSVGKRPQDLKLIYVDNVQNPEARSAIMNVYKMNGNSAFNAADITAKASVEAGSVERNSFNTLLGTLFGIGADKLRQQYSVGKQITAFKVSNHKGADGNNIPGQFVSAENGVV
ncbi:hypothetical protein DM02DRAFT_685683 [Periconia macrospinosa]|uniref:Uncharacterized protein n=1 Tax=Periconia macrospinosa TaxID=97972 RepID=A0A2V1DH00_9PLEO|nr:hypothetical protein DM02DRAFT_685683 [Periconia macrospinosa]